MSAASLAMIVNTKRPRAQSAVWTNRLLCAVCVQVLLQSVQAFLPMQLDTHILRSTESTLQQHSVQALQSHRQRDAALHMVATQARRDVRTLHKHETQHSTQQQRSQARREPPLWTTSIAGDEHPLSYIPFMDWSLKTLTSAFDISSVALAPEVALKPSINPTKPGRMMSREYSSPEIRKIRMTYFDAGPAVQVFNMVIYPDPSLDVPMLGVDLISFGKKHLAGIDFQPLYTKESQPEYHQIYTSALEPIKSKYPDLSQQMSARFYDSAKFFSDHMLFARFEDTSVIPEQLFPAFSNYLDLYVKTLKGAKQNKSPEALAAVLERHAAYDQYNAERDPAHGLFVTYFGNDWAENYIDDFLFELSVRPEGGYPKIHHGSPQGQQPKSA